MGTVTSASGLFSGLDTQSIISQLLAIDARPKVLAQQRSVQLKGIQTALLDVSSRLSVFKTAAEKFRVNSVFTGAVASSSNSGVLTATASKGALAGVYSFIVDRLATTQQLRSRGFADTDATGLGATSFTFETAQARLDSDTLLSSLNGGDGVSRGKILVTDSTGASATVDLSKAATVNDVLEAINTASGVRVTASITGDGLRVTDAAGGAGKLTIANASGYTTAASLGIAGTADVVGTGGKISGTPINRLGLSSSLRSLNDGLGVVVNTASGDATPDFRITARSGQTFDVDIGDVYQTVDGKLTKTKSAVVDIAGVIQRINEATGGAVTASIAPDGVSLQLTDTSTPGGADPKLKVEELNGRTTAKDLGLLGETAGATLGGRRLIAGLNSVLAGSLRGGQGLADGSFFVTTRDGALHSFTVSTNASLTDIFSQISAATGGKVTAGLDQTGMRIVLTDTTGGPDEFIVQGAGAVALGVDTDAGGVQASTVTGLRSQKKYIGDASLLSELNSGKGIGTGQFEIVDALNQAHVINIDSSVKTVGDLVTRINAQAQNIRARINDNGDGILIEEVVPGGGTAGGSKISVRDRSGAVAKALNLVGTAGGTGASNFLNGSYERTVTFAATDTLNQVLTKINAAGAGVNATIINESSASNPFRLVLSSASSGARGRFTVDTGGFDLGLTTQSAGDDARAFYGSEDPAKGVLISSATNSLDGVVSGVSIDLKGVSKDVVTVGVSKDTAGIEAAVNEFVAAYNAVVGRIRTLGKYDAETKERGVLLGETLTQSLEQGLINAVSGRAKGVVSRFDTLGQVGVALGAKGELKVDSARLREALAEDPQGVADLFSARVEETNSDADEFDDGIIVTGGTTEKTFSSLGVAEQLSVLADRYLNSTSGLFTRRDKALGDQIKSQNDRMAQIDKRIERKRAIYERQFLNMEKAIATLQSQSGTLSGLANLSATKR